MNDNELRLSLITFWRQEELRCTLDMTIEQLIEKWESKGYVSIWGYNFYKKWFRILVVDVFDFYRTILIVFVDLMYMSPIAPFKLYV